MAHTLFWFIWLQRPISGWFLTSLTMLMSVYRIIPSPRFPAWGHTYSKMLKNPVIIITQTQGWVLTFPYTSRCTQHIWPWDCCLPPLSYNWFMCNEGNNHEVYSELKKTEFLKLLTWLNESHLLFQLFQYLFSTLLNAKHPAKCCAEAKASEMPAVFF